MKKLSKSDQDPHAPVDEVTWGTPTQHFAVGTYVVRQNKCALILGRHDESLLVQWEDGSLSLITPNCI